MPKGDVCFRAYITDADSEPRLSFKFMRFGVEYKPWDIWSEHLDLHGPIVQTPEKCPSCAAIYCLVVMIEHLATVGLCGHDDVREALRRRGVGEDDATVFGFVT